MASRYGYQDDERFGERRGQYRRGESEGRFGRGFERGGESSGGYSGSRFGRFEGDEGYFGGGGGEGYGEGYTGGWGGSGDWDVGNWRSASFDQPRRRYSQGRMSGESDYGYRGESSRGRYFGGGGTSRGRTYDEGGFYGQGRRYGSSYPESERGYMRGREQYGRGEYEGEERGWLDRASDEISSWFGDEDAERRREMDARRGGMHRGRGPRGYTRSDDRIKEDINDRLTDYPYIDASDIEIEVSSGEVVLTGNVDTRYEKRLAEDIVEDISGVRNVENRIRVESSRTTSEGGWAYTDTAGHTETGRSTGAASGRGATTGRGSTTSAAGSTTSGSTTGRGTTSTTGRGTTGSATGTTGSTSTTAKTRSASGGR